MAGLVEAIRDIEDIKELERYLKKHSKTHYAVFETGIYTGLRVSDILKLKVSDVINKDYVEVIEKKTGKRKQFPLVKKLREILNEYIEYHGRKYNDFLFTISNRSTVYRALNKAVEKIGIEGNFGTHTMRKTFGYHHYKQFKNVALLQMIFNHSSPAITLRYIGITQEEINDSYDKFSYDKGIKQVDNRTLDRKLNKILKMLGGLNEYKEITD